MPEKATSRPAPQPEGQLELVLRGAAGAEHGVAEVDAGEPK